MSIIETKQKYDFYSLLNSMTVDELEEFIGQSEETGLAQALSVDYCCAQLENTVGNTL